ncbi:putative transposase [Psychrobacter sp. PL15]|uniref:IS200/IS605 family element RNA-guided endonuclease TnpB n=1 Tax=Psychrobacter sp. PL15 TaxID=3071719 RepID=UPI002DFC67A2|nr:putative transposase [Psychrobacter sp. PL15]
MSKPILKAYKFRLYPTDDQQVYFAKSFGCARFIWNRMLADKINHYKLHKESLKNTPAQYKKEFEWLKEVDSLALANVQINLQRAFQSFFKSPTFGFPNFKHKGKKDSYTTNNQKGTIAVGLNRIKLPKIGHIKANIDRKTTGLVKSATITKTATGKYFVSILVETVAVDLPKTQSNIGIDLGLTDFIVLSDGTKIANPKFLARLQGKLAKAQRILSKRARVAKAANRKLSESCNYQKQNTNVAKIHERIRNTRTDFLHKTSFNIVKNHDIIAIEDLNVKGLLKNHKLAKAIADSSWSTFTNMLTYKADWYGKTVIKVDRWYPSSKTCSCCGHILGKGELKLSDRAWVCKICLTQHHRDINASINILNEGLRCLQTLKKTLGSRVLAW